MPSKRLFTFLLALTFLFLFSGSVFGQETEVKKEYHDKYGGGAVPKVIGKTEQLKEETHFKNGKKNGPYRKWSYRSTGRKTIEGQYKDGKKEGRWRWWYENGTKELIKHYKDGVENGERIEYSIFRTVKFRGNFVDGVQR